MRKKKLIKEYDDFSWVKDINPKHSIENILGKKLYFRSNNLGELKDLGYSEHDTPKRKIILGKIRWSDYFVVEDVDLKKGECLIHLYPNKYKSPPVKYTIDEVENLVRIGVWVLGDEINETIKEVDDFDWIKDTPEVSIGGKNGLPIESVPLGTKVVTPDGDVFTIEDITGGHMGFQHVWGRDLKRAWLGPKNDDDNKNWHNTLWLRRATPEDLTESKESDSEWDWVKDSMPLELMEPQSFVGKSFGYGNRIKKQMSTTDIIHSNHEEYFTIDSIDENGNLSLVKHHPQFGESTDSTTTIKNLITFINNGAWVWIEK